MSQNPALPANTERRVRKSLQELERKYTEAKEKGGDEWKNTELIKLMRAWKKISHLPADHQHSFHYITSNHGAPFKGAGYKDPYYWGGYCQHGNILFPMWHRLFVLEMETALRNESNDDTITIPYWDETVQDDVMNKPFDVNYHYVPWSLTQRKIDLGQGEEDNPLHSYVFVEEVIDSTTDVRPGYAPYDYTKCKGYRTTRFPLSGLKKDIVTYPLGHKHAHGENCNGVDKRWEGREEQATRLLNANIKFWLTGPVQEFSGRGSARARYFKSLETEDYLFFSNNTSVGEWNATHPNDVRVSMERGHNDMHIAVGGFSILQDDKELEKYITDEDLRNAEGSNGDMGCNESASYDPLFFFHHSYNDYIFTVWQKRYGKFDGAAIQATLNHPKYRYYPGTNSSDEQGATIGIPANTRLTFETPLEPFEKRSNGNSASFYTGLDCFDSSKIPALKTTLNPKTEFISVEYEHGSLADYADPAKVAQLRAKANYLSEEHNTLVVSGLNRNLIHGSFDVKVTGILNGKRTILDVQSVLSRWHTRGCANCQNHLDTPLTFVIPKDVKESTVEVQVDTHDEENAPGLLRSGTSALKAYSTKFYYNTPKAGQSAPQ